MYFSYNPRWLPEIYGNINRPCPGAVPLDSVSMLLMSGNYENLVSVIQCSCTLILHKSVKEF